MTQQGRRGFVKWFLGTSLGALAASIVYPLARFLDPPRLAEQSVQQVEAGLANDPELMERGFKIVRFGNDPVIVMRVGDGDFRAFSATCTHLDCIVEYRPGQKVMWCNCHNGVYDLSGRNIGGPPPRPLIPYVVHTVPRSGGVAQLVVTRA